MDLLEPMDKAHTYVPQAAMKEDQVRRLQNPQIEADSLSVQKQPLHFQKPGASPNILQVNKPTAGHPHTIHLTRRTQRNATTGGRRKEMWVPNGTALRHHRKWKRFLKVTQ